MIQLFFKSVCPAAKLRRVTTKHRLHLGAANEEVGKILSFYLVKAGQSPYLRQRTNPA